MTYPIGPAAHLRASHTFLESAGPSSDQAVSLKRFVVLNMLGELAKRIGRRGAFGATEERHDRWETGTVRR